MFTGNKPGQIVLVLLFLLLLALPTHDQAVDLLPWADDSGREITLPTNIQKIYATTEEGLFLVYALKPETIIGWNRGLSPHLEFAIEPRFHHLPTVGTWNEDYQTILVDVVLASQPDLILHLAPLDHKNMLLAEEIQEKLGIPTILMDNSLTSLANSLRTLGGIVQKEERGNALATFTENRLDRAQNFLETRRSYGKIPVQIVSDYPPGYFEALLELAGMVELPAHSPLFPDFVLVMPHNIADPYFELERAGLKRIYQIPAFPLEWLNPTSIFGLLGLEWLLSIAYPGYYPTDLGTTYELFMEVFFGVNVTPAMLEWTLRRSGISY